jgi:hypothetical protein
MTGCACGLDGGNEKCRTLDQTVLRNHPQIMDCQEGKVIFNQNLGKQQDYAQLEKGYNGRSSY